MSKKKEDQTTTAQEEENLAWLIKPAKDLVENFSIDVLKILSSYLDVIRKSQNENAEQLDAAGNYKVFDFQQACRVLSGSVAVAAKKVDLVYEMTLAVVDLVENRKNEDGAGGRKAGRRRNVQLGSTNYELIDFNTLLAEVSENYGKEEKEVKKAIDDLRLVDNAEMREAQYERKNCLVAKPTQFMFKLNYGQLNRTDEQVQNSKARPEVIGKVKDFDIKKSDMHHDQQVLYTNDCYKNNADQFTLPGARWIPDNKELAANFGVADIEVELDLAQESEKVNAYGPFKDPLSGREVVAPPKWFVEQEAVRQQHEIQSRATSRAATRASAAAIRDSQGFSQPTRLSQPLVEKHRNNLNQFVSFVEGRLNKNRPSTHLNTGLVDMFVDNFGGGGGPGGMTEDFGCDGGGMDVEDYDDGQMGRDDDDDAADDYVANLSKRRERRAPAPWDDIENTTYQHWYTGDEDIPVTRKPVKVMEKEPPTPMETMKRKQRKEQKMGKSRRDQFMETHDYMQDYYYWRSAARINPNKDWKVEALRAAILKEKKRRAKERTVRIKEAREKAASKRRTTRATVAIEDYEAALEGGEDLPTTNRRTLGTEYEDIADEDLAAEVEISMLGGAYDDDEDDVQPRGELPPIVQEDVNFDAPPASFYQPPAPAERHPLRFDDIDDAELNSVINLPGNLLIDKALPLLKKFAENRTDREQMAYEMAKAYEDVDMAVSTLQEQVDKWHAQLESILDEGETRKEYDVHEVGRAVLSSFKTEGEEKLLIDLVVGRPWYEISRYFLACLFMCNVHNVMITEDREKPLEERINSMKIQLLSREMHHEVFKQGNALD